MAEFVGNMAVAPIDIAEVLPELMVEVRPKIWPQFALENTALPHVLAGLVAIWFPVFAGVRLATVGSIYTYHVVPMRTEGALVAVRLKDRVADMLEMLAVVTDPPAKNSSVANSADVAATSNPFMNTKPVLTVSAVWVP